MNKKEILEFIFSKPEWREHFIKCSKLKINRVCCHINPSKYYDNEKRIAYCQICNKEIENWYSIQIQDNKPSISDIIKDEEERFFQLMEEKEPFLILLKDDLTGETLSWLHQTHGIDPDYVQDILCIKLSEEQKDEYKKYYEIHRKSGLVGYKPKIIEMR